MRNCQLIPGLIGLEDEEESGTVKHRYDMLRQDECSKVGG